MNEEPPKSVTTVQEPGNHDDQRPEEESVEAERDDDAQSAEETIEPTGPNLTKKPSMEPKLQEILQDIKQEGTPGGDAPLDWLEPLEEDDDVDNLSRNDHDEESVAGESEWSESLAGSEKAFKRIYHSYHGQRRTRSDPNDGWVDWPTLGEGWKRKEVVRRSGSSVGQKDVYYMSPRGDRVRSRVELVSIMEGNSKIEKFHYKSGNFYDGDAPPMRIRRKRKVRERSSSESSWMERGEGADTPDSFHRLTPSQAPRKVQNNPTAETPHSEDDESRPKIPPDASSSIQWSLSNEALKSYETLLCSKCGVSYSGTWYDKKRKRPVCPPCWGVSKSTEHPWYRFRKWIPCGQCCGCRNSVNCNNCVNCKYGVDKSKTRKRICYYRKCLYPIRRLSKSCSDSQQTLDDSTGLPEVKDEVTDSQQASLKSSDTENVSLNVDAEDDDDDDMSTDDDDDWHRKRKRRACGQCLACQCRKDCGTCDFCVDKPKFGGSNKKRQKCRLRQCERQAMMVEGELAEEGAQLLGRPRLQYTYSRKSGLKEDKKLSSGLDCSDNEQDDFQEQLHHSDSGQQNGLSDKDASNSQRNTSGEQLRRWDAEKSRLDSGGGGQDEDDYSEELEEEDQKEEEEEEEEEEELPMISQIFSLADQPPESSLNVDNELMKLLESLRLTAMPSLWYAIMVDGPQLHLIQCSKLSTMADTIVTIDPGFFYQVTVQRQPLLPTHPLYARFPGRLTSVTVVVDLLLALEKYVVCQGLPPPQQFLHKSPLIFERASTCEFLIQKNLRSCPSCLALRGY